MADDGWINTLNVPADQLKPYKPGELEQLSDTIETAMSAHWKERESPPPCYHRIGLLPPAPPATAQEQAVCHATSTLIKLRAVLKLYEETADDVTNNGTVQAALMARIHYWEYEVKRLLEDVTLFF